MREVSSADIQRNSGAYRELAQGVGGEPQVVSVLHYNKPSVVILSAAEYTRLERRDKHVALAEDLPEWLVERIGAGEMDTKFAHPNDAE